MATRVIAANRHLLREEMGGYEDTQARIRSMGLPSCFPASPRGWVMTGFLRGGDEKSYFGCDGWLFYRQSVDSVTGPGFLTPRMATRTFARQRTCRSPLPATGPAQSVDPVPSPIGRARHRIGGHPDTRQGKPCIRKKLTPQWSSPPGCCAECFIGHVQVGAGKSRNRGLDLRTVASGGERNAPAMRSILKPTRIGHLSCNGNRGHTTVRLAAGTRPWRPPPRAVWIAGPKDNPCPAPGYRRHAESAPNVRSSSRRKQFRHPRADGRRAVGFG